MEPIFNPHGKSIGWIDNDVIYDRSNRYRAFVSDGNVFTYQGRHLGVLDNGFSRDKFGYCVAFIKGASGGPIPPIPEIAPVPRFR